MGHVKLFEDFLNEKKSSVDSIHDMFETSLVKQDFIKEICEKDPSTAEGDYELDSQKNGAGDGWDVWIEIQHIKPEAFEAIKDYKKFAEPFEKWAKDNGLFDPSILTNDDDKDNLTMTFEVTAY
jgi:hypothetical protein